MSSQPAEHAPDLVAAVPVTPARVSGPGWAGTPAPNPDWHQAWVAALDELEFDLAAAEQLLAEVRRGHELPAIDPWSPPAGLGPLPLDLRPRADGILARQLRVATEIAAGLSLNRRQATVAARLESGSQETQRPAYLDCAM